jgi:tRNA (guanine37-N1)-methyltransferase
VPEVLLSGHHADIERWRLAQSLARTLERRPDLLARWQDGRELSKQEQKLLAGIRAEHGKAGAEQEQGNERGPAA